MDDVTLTIKVDLIHETLIALTSRHNALLAEMKEASPTAKTIIRRQLDRVNDAIQTLHDAIN